MFYQKDNPVSYAQIFTRNNSLKGPRAYYLEFHNEIYSHFFKCLFYLKKKIHWEKNIL